MSKKKERQQELDQNELLTWTEKQLGNFMPYAQTVGIFCLVALAAFALAVFLIGRNRVGKEAQWRELNLALTETNLNGNSKRLLDVAEEYPDQKASMWALQMAGDFDLRTGIAQLAYDREGGTGLIEKALGNLKKVLNGKESLKSPELQRRNLYSLAYAAESLGKFDEAEGYYKQIVEAAPDSAFGKSAQRALMRTSDKNMVALYNKFSSWEDVSDEAPGALVPESPSIDFPSIGDDPIFRPMKEGENPMNDPKEEFSPTSEAEQSGVLPASVQKAAETVSDTVSDAANATIDKAAEVTGEAAEALGNAAEKTVDAVKETAEAAKEAAGGGDQ